MTDAFDWYVLPVNPEPWAIGDLSVGRKGKSVYPMVGRNHQLHNYKEAVKEALQEAYEPAWIEPPIDLLFFFYRRRDAYQTPQARGHRKHEADLTNLQKATEDALQGLLFKNDKDVRHIDSWMGDQSEVAEPCVVIGVRHLENTELQTSILKLMPLDVITRISEIRDSDLLENTFGDIPF